MSDSNSKAPVSPELEATNFIRAIVAEDLKTGKHDGRVVTRFPPEPNGYLHIGHAKSICLNFGIAAEVTGGVCHLRFDDTNPVTEDTEYVDSIQKDIRWLGFDWDTKLFHASDQFEKLYDLAVKLIRDGKAYVDSSTEEEIRENRGSIEEAGKPGLYRDRNVEENLDLFTRMRAGEFKDGEHVLRAKIDLAANNMKMRDPLIYRIRHAHHYRTGDTWCIYPLYDFAHGQCDALEGVTHSFCTLEFENNRELYDWLTEHLEFELPPKQFEFARLNLNYTLMSKRKLLQLVNEGHVTGWDDPRMPTLSGLRRRGYTPESIRNFCERIGVAKAFNIIDIGHLEYSIRDDLNPKVRRALCVVDPLKVVIENYPENAEEDLLSAPWYPHDVPLEGERQLPFAREIYIEREDFTEDPPAKWFRLAPGREVRLRYAYFIKCEKVIKNDAGEVIELRCTYDPATRGGQSPDGRKVQGTIHWVSAEHSLQVETRIYDRLFNVEAPGAGDSDFRQQLNPDSLRIMNESRVEPALAGSQVGTSFQFERQGYFVVDPDSTDEKLVFNRTVTLRDTWAKIAQKEAGEAVQQKSRKTKVQAQPKVSEEEMAAARAAARSPEQAQRFARYNGELGLSEQEASLLADDDAVAGIYEDALAAGGDTQDVARWIVNELLRELKTRAVGDLPFGGAELAQLTALIAQGDITATAGKEVFAAMLEAGDAAAASPQRIVEERGLSQMGTDATAGIIEEVLAENDKKVEQYRAGKTNLMGFFMGQVMRKSAGRADAQQVKAILGEKLGG